MNQATLGGTSKAPVGLVAILLIAAVFSFSKSPPKPLSIGFQPPLLPIKILIDHSGAVALSISEKLQTPLGTFEIGSRTPVTPTDSELAIIVRNLTAANETHYRLMISDRVTFEKSSVVKSIQHVEPNVLLVEITAVSPSIEESNLAAASASTAKEMPRQTKLDVPIAKPPTAGDRQPFRDATLPIDPQLPHEADSEFMPPMKSAEVNLPWSGAAEFLRNFTPQQGIFEAWIVHPHTGRATLVHFHLPGSRLKGSRAGADSIRFSYRDGKIRSVAILFERDGRVSVTYD